jgi:hypothetical protein
MPIIAPKGYDRRVHTAYCPPITKILDKKEYRTNACRDADFLFRIAFADDKLEAVRATLGGGYDET